MRQLAAAVTVAVIAFLFFPILLIVVVSFDPAPLLQFPPDGFSLNWYRTFLADTPLLTALGRSVVLGVAAAVISAALGTAIAVVVVRHTFAGRGLLNGLTMIPMVMPRIILGVALLAVVNLVQLPRGWPYLIIGHSIMVLPYVVLVVSSQLYAVDTQLEEASVNLGAGRLRTFFEITLPLIVPGVIAGMVFAFTVSLQDAEASLMWASPTEPTLPLAILVMITNRLTPEINAVAVVMIAISVILPILAERVAAASLWRPAMGGRDH